jgi:hypothetical protein
MARHFSRETNVKPFLASIVLLAAPSSFAQGQPASEESIRELMTITNSKALLDQSYGQLDGLMQQAMKDALAGNQTNAEQEKLMAELRSRMVELIRADMSWDELEPEYIKLYATTFSQAEIDGINAFYRSDTGKAVIGKMPQLMQSLMQMVMGKMQGLAPKIQALSEEYKKKLSDAGN